MKFKATLIMYAAYIGLYMGYFAYNKRKVKKLRKKMEKENLKRKAEANGWTIVECDYVITSRTIEAI